MPSPCPRCGLEIHGKHLTPEDCLRTISPRYKLAQWQVIRMGKRIRTLEERLDRARIQVQEAKRKTRRVTTWEGRVRKIERELGIGA